MTSQKSDAARLARGVRALGSLLLRVRVIGELPCTVDSVPEADVDRSSLGWQGGDSDGCGCHTRRVIEVGRSRCSTQVEIVDSNPGSRRPGEDYVGCAEHGAWRGRSQYRRRGRGLGVGVIGRLPKPLALVGTTFGFWVRARSQGKTRPASNEQGKLALLSAAICAYCSDMDAVARIASGGAQILQPLGCHAAGIAEDSAPTIARSRRCASPRLHLAEKLN